MIRLNLIPRSAVRFSNRFRCGRQKNNAQIISAG